MRSPYAIALALFFALRYSFSLFARGRHRARFVHAHLVYFSYLTCFNRLRSRCLSAWRSAFPSTSDHSLCSLRSAFLSTECFPFAPHKLFQTSPISSTMRIHVHFEFGGTLVCMPAKFEVHVDTHAQNRALQMASLLSSVIHFASVEICILYTSCSPSCGLFD